MPIYFLTFLCRLQSAYVLELLYAIRIVEMPCVMVVAICLRIFQFLLLTFELGCLTVLTLAVLYIIMTEYKMT